MTAMEKLKSGDSNGSADHEEESSLDKYVEKQLALLELEREEEVEQNAKLQEKYSVKELQSKGLCIAKLVVDSAHTGLYGRTVCKFRSCHHGAPLPSHRFSNGDIVGVAVASDPAREVVCSGVVSSIAAVNITLAFDEGRDTLDGDDGRVFNLLKLANDVTYRRLKRTLEKLRKCREVRYNNLVEILFGTVPPTEVPVLTSQQPIELFNKALDESQKEAVAFSLRQKELAIIHGPPGTGKTTTLVEVVLQCSKQGSKVLVCAPSNVAVDNLVERLSGTSLKVVRLGHPARLLPGIAWHSLDAILARSDDFGIIGDIRKEIDDLTSSTAKSKAKGYQMRGKLAELRKELKDRERRAIGRILANADVVLSTLTTASDDGPLRNLPDGHFQVAVIDECSQSLEVACWMALLRAPKCILAGDHHQLPPTIVSEAAAKGGLEVTLMERALRLRGEAIVRMLVMQYRMHELIMRWSSDRFYAGKLVAHASVAAHLLRDLPGVEDNDDTALPLLLIDTAGCGMIELDTPDDESKGNEGEADLVSIHVERLVSSGVPASEIAVISPYNLQVELIRLRLSSRHPGLEIRSVDGFQGREKDAVVMSFVRSNDTGTVGFLAEDRRINVAVTRARRHLAVVCDSTTMSRHDFLRSLVDYISDEGEVRSAREYTSDLELCSSTPRPSTLRATEVNKRASKSRQQPAQDAQNVQGMKPRQASKQNDAQRSRRTTEGTTEASPWEAVVQSFADSTDKQQSLPSSLSAYERRMVHEVAEKLGLIHVSEGNGDKRHIVLRKCAPQGVASGTPCSQDERNKSGRAVLEGDTDLTGVATLKPTTIIAEGSYGASSAADKPTTLPCTKVQQTKMQQQKKKKQPAKPPAGGAKEEEDFDELIANVMTSDRVCAFVKCSEKLHTALAGIGGPCPFCRRGFCFKHALPEVHGCGKEACRQARIAWHRSKGGTVAPSHVKPEKRAQVQKALDKRLTQMAESRKRQTKK
ncbi:DNA-binding protein SMUBP-2-like isoform X1 [Dermacentor variabilis]|uniref:DNA-binding protein SMUBP-2-like isoform X1 n=1 Tax=Dermacentor variabilis TaxID=34621 RepID=UPI003F5B48DD